MLDTLRRELESRGAFKAPDHEFVEALTRAIPFNTVPTKMKTLFALSHLSTYASQFRRNIELWDGTSVPTNSIAFVVADSGANKDSSNSKVKKCFKTGYEQIHKFLETHTRREAIRKATQAGEELPEEYTIYSKYMSPIPPVFMGITTGPGLVQHINDIGALPASSGSMFSGEISDELAHNIHATDNIKILAEVYDTGQKEVTYTKGKEFRSAAIDGQPVSALFVGSPGHILYDEATRKKFQIAFMSKLARRSWFCYSPERLYEPDFSSEPDPIAAMTAYEQAIENASKEAVAAVKGAVDRLTRFNLESLGRPVTVSKEVFQLFSIYKRYNREVVDKANNQETITALVRSHLQWKALKLAGAFAVLEQCDEVTEEHYITAIRYSELYDQDVAQFEKDMNKAPHECLSDYLQSILTAEGRSFISVHDMKKHGFTNSISLPKLQELVSLSAGYDSQGVYTIGENGSGIFYEPLNVTSVLSVSFKKIDNSALHRAIAENAPQERIKKIKQNIALHTADGYTCGETSFEELGEMLKGDFAYAPFVFKDGVRGRSNIIGGTKWVVFDVDKSTVSYEDASFILEGYKHHIALSSNPNNPYKYRILLELDAPVQLSAIAWKCFYTKLAEDLGINADILPQSQIYFSFANRPVLSNLEGEAVKSRDLVMYAKEQELNKNPEKIKTIPNGQKQALLDNPFDTFWYAFNSKEGQRSLNLYRAGRHAQDLGASLEYTHKLLEDINEYTVKPMDSLQLERLQNQITRLYGDTNAN